MSEIQIFNPGDTLLREGDTGHGLFELMSGVLTVHKNGHQIALINEPGTFFGEMSDILGHPRSCTIVAETVAEVLVVPLQIDEIIRQYPDITKRLIVSLAGRLETTTHKLQKAVDTVLLVAGSPSTQKRR